MLAGFTNVVAIAGTSIDIKWLSTEKKLMDVTLALDADTEGQRNTDLIMDRINGTGITAHACSAPNDGKGKDWSERYKCMGLAGLCPLLNFIESMFPSPVAVPQEPADPPADDSVQDVCVLCGATVEYYSESGQPYCAQHWEARVELDRDTIIARFADVFPKCHITIDPVGFTIDDRIRQMEAERGHARTQEDYWTATRRKLQARGYYEQVARDLEALRNRGDVPRVYPAPFPKFELVETDGIKRVVQVGMWQSADVEQKAFA